MLVTLMLELRYEIGGEEAERERERQRERERERERWSEIERGTERWWKGQREGEIHALGHYIIAPFRIKK